MKDSTPIKSDWHNCLKLGYDVRNKQWPEWMVPCLEDAGIGNPLDGDGVIPMQVVSPGQPMGYVDEDVCKRLGLPPNVAVVGVDNLFKDYELFENEFNAFFPQVIDYVKAEMMEIQT